MAAIYSGDAHIVRKLIYHGADPNLKRDGYPPPHIAAFFGHQDIAGSPQARKAHPNDTAERWGSVLNAALKHLDPGHASAMVAILIDGGVDVNEGAALRHRCRLRRIMGMLVL